MDLMNEYRSKLCTAEEAVRLVKSGDWVDYGSNNGYPSTLDAALWAFNATATFEEGMIAAVNLGGDSDTIGAVFGQIAGAFYGFEAIPKRWVQAVKTWEKVDAFIERFLDAVEV